MPRFYTVEFEAQTIANASGDVDLFEVAPADDRPVELVSISLGQTSELGDAQEEQVRIRVIRGHATTGNGTSTTPRPGSPADSAASAACEVLGTTIASTGTAVNLLSDTWNLRAGFQWGPVPQGMGLWCSQTEGLIVVRLMAAVADDITASGTLGFIEYP